MKYTRLNFNSIATLLPVLTLLNGYAVQREAIESYTLDFGQLTEIEFPMMVLKRVTLAGESNQHGWALMDKATLKISTVFVP